MERQSVTFRDHPKHCVRSSGVTCWKLLAPPCPSSPSQTKSHPTLFAWHLQAVLRSLPLRPQPARSRQFRRPPTHRVGKSGLAAPPVKHLETQLQGGIEEKTAFRVLSDGGECAHFAQSCTMDVSWTRGWHNWAPAMEPTRAPWQPLACGALPSEEKKTGWTTGMPAEPTDCRTDGLTH